MTPVTHDDDDSVTSAWFEAIGTTNSITGDVWQLTDAVEIARTYLAALDRAASRFRPDSELSRLNQAAARGPVTATVSPLLARVLAAGLRVARLTGGLVDPTVGEALSAIGYNRDLPDVVAGAPPRTRRPENPIGWDRVRLDAGTRLLTMPQGTTLDVGASGKAFAADDIARLLSRDLSGGFLVDLGGDVAVAGDIPRGGWRIGVQAADGSLLQVVTSRGQALATSSTRIRRWRTSNGEAHHVIDPRTGTSADAVWAQVTCSAATALEANAATTAAVVLGEQAPDWLAARDLTCLLLRPTGEQLRLGGWPVGTGQPADPTARTEVTPRP